MIRPASSASTGVTVVLGKYQNMPSEYIARLRARCRACGFTLIELMITLAVAAILAMIAVPNFKHLLVSTHLSGISNELAGDLQYARTQAVSRQVNVAVAASAGSWQNGWAVEAISGSTTETLRTHPAVADQYVISAVAATSVAYQPQGSLANPAGGTCFTIYAPDSENNQPLYLDLSSSGSLRQATGPDKPDACTAPP